MNKTKRIICITLCVLLIALSAAGVIWALYSKFSKQEAHADYVDLAGTNTLVNFNQIATASHSDYNNYGLTLKTANNVIFLNGTPQFNLTFDIGTINLVANHKYYYFSDNNYVQFNVVDNFLFTQQPYIVSAVNSGSFGTQLKVLVHNFDNVYVHLNFIDLTLMFGEGNEPNLQQAQEYFTAEYYTYTTGQMIPYSKDYLQGYQDGANDLYESMTITYNAYTIGSTSATYANNTIERGQIVFDQQYGAYMFSGVIGVNLMGNVERGTNFDIDFEIYIPDLQGENNPSYAESNYFLHFAYVDENNVLNDITTLTGDYIGALTISYKGSFVLPITTSTIYIYVDYNTIGENYSPTQCFAFKSEMTFKSTDMGLLMNNAYQRGYSSAMATYTPGTDNYNAIYQLGFNNGVAQQNATLGTMEYIGAAFTGIGSILAIELLPGIPFSLFVLLPLMFGLIAFVVKLSKGGD